MSDLQVIAIASGKGGVGKTMLAVAIANELSRGQKTLLFDLDFFNRGLTGLFASLSSKTSQRAIQPPRLLMEAAGTAADMSSWVVSEVGKNLFVICYDDLDKHAYDLLETLDVDLLAKELLSYIEEIADQCQCRFAVLDCHGGPDNTSFAACLLAAHTVLVSEPDRITLHGTLNFLRTLRRQAPRPITTIHLVFNKVVPAFSSIFLFRFYKDYLQTEFSGHPLLGIFPLEIYLTKAFEKVPFLTTVYPRSQLASKARLVLRDLFRERLDLLPRPIRKMSWVERTFVKYYMGRWPKLLTPDFVLKGCAVLSVIFFTAPTLPEIAGFKIPVNSPPLQMVLATLFCWWIAMLGLQWSSHLDVYNTYALRSRAYFSAAAGMIFLSLVWAIFTLMLIGSFQSYGNVTLPGVEIRAFPFFAIVGLVYAMLFFWVGFRTLTRDRQYVEGTFRMILSAGAVIGATVGMHS